MPNFSIKYSYVARDDLVVCKTCIVRASSIDSAHDKLIRYLTRDGHTFDQFTIIKTSLSSYNLVLS